MSTPRWDRDRDVDPTRLDMHPADDPVPPGGPEPVVEESVDDPALRRVRTVRIVNAVINLVCGLFALVLAIHIILVLAEANPSNGFASLINSWSSAVSLGLRDLFTPASDKLAVLLNDGLAALIWLIIGAALTYAVRMFALPGPRRVTRYRRVAR
jgi:hypothetical protein